MPLCAISSKIKEKLCRKGEKMSRKVERIKKQLEKNPIIECNKVQKRFCPKLFQRFSETVDPRHQSYTEYNNKLMLGTVYYKGIGGITTMRDMDDTFNQDKVVSNIRYFLGEGDADFLPHGVTINEYMEKLEPSELQGIIQDEIYDLIRRKTFDEAKFNKKWIVIIDGTQLYSGSRQINENCLERHYNKETEHETVNYYNSVLEAKIVFGEKMIVSIASEFIENNGEDAKRRKKMSEEERKQDCERNAFERLAERIKSKFPRLPMILLVDSLYASEKFMTICKENRWDYIIRYKSGSIPSISEEYEAIPEKEQERHAEYVNAIDYREHSVNMIKYWEEKIIKKEVVRTDFQWLTNIKISKKNAEKLAALGRMRWKIENEGFNRQKKWQSDITHACSWNETALKNHYLMLQISDMIKQLYEWFYLKKNEIKKKQKNISSELLSSFGRQLTREDISLSDTQSVSQT
jgi:hypothetical protein